MRNIVKNYTTPTENDPDAHARLVVLYWILLGSATLGSISLCITLFYLFTLQDGSYFPRAVVSACIAGLFIGMFALSRKKYFVTQISLFIVLLFVLLSTNVLVQWGLINPIGILVLSLSIIMSSILIGAKYSLYFALLASGIVAGIYLAVEQGYVTPNTSWAQESVKPSDVLIFSTLFAIIALISWLFNRQMEHSLQRAHRSEAALRRQKAVLEVRVEERTRELEKLQLEKMQQFYRFAELGRLSTSLFHDLANHLTTMNIDIEGLGKNDQSKIMQRLQHNAGYIDDVIRRVREQLLGKEETEAFKIQDEISEIVKILQPKAKQAGVTITCKSAKKSNNLEISGSLTRFRQMIINLLSNAIDSYDTTPERTKTVSVSVSQNKTTIAIVIKDEGCGIAPEIQRNIFKPFYSTKHDGIGIGLFIVKQITEQYFKGTLTLNSSENIGSTFTIKIPKNAK